LRVEIWKSEVVKSGIVRPDPEAELMTSERCAILESWNDESDDAVSIARARVEPGVTTQLHRLDVDERYVIVEGRGRVRVGELPVAQVGTGDVVLIPAGTQQQITNDRDSALVFYCICSPRFDPAGYEPLE
jgi:mannose-6-phosphate isomerase-like protein (cupin superfamily)